MSKNENLCLETNYCDKNLGLSRKKMPQLNDDVLKKYIKYLRSKKIKVYRRKYSVHNIKPSQNELYKPAIKKKQRSIKKKGLKKMDPIVISNNNYILDGHHRWATMKDCSINIKKCSKKNDFPQKILAYKIDMPIRKLIKNANNFDGTYNINLGSSK